MITSRSVIDEDVRQCFVADLRICTKEVSPCIDVAHSGDSTNGLSWTASQLSGLIFCCMSSTRLLALADLMYP